MLGEKPEKAVIFPCSGGSNCGQIANQVAVTLTTEGACNMSCLAGIGAHDQEMIDSARSTKTILAIDGCTVACAKKALEHAGIEVTKWVCVTEEGIKKTAGKFNIAPEEVTRIAHLAKETIAQPI
jgi:uncharacterized metal-binding protein